LRQNQSVSRNDQHIRLERGQLCDDVIVAQRERLQHRNFVLRGILLDRARRQVLAAAGRAIGLRQNGNRDAPRFDERA